MIIEKLSHANRSEKELRVTAKNDELMIPVKVGGSPLK